MTTKVCLIGDGWFPDDAGGLNRYLRSLLEGLTESSSEIEPSAVVLGPASDAPSRVRIAEDSSAPFLRRLVKTARAYPADSDVVDAHFAPYALWPVLSARMRGKGIVAHFHGPWADESVAAGERSRRSLWVKRQIEQAVYRRAHEIVVLSQAFRSLLIERYRVVPWRVTVIPPSVDLRHFSPGDRASARRRLALPEEAWIAASVRRLVPRMGLDLLLEAWVDAKPRDGLLLIAGDGPERDRLDQRSAEIGGRDSIRLLGRLNDDDLADLYRAADVTIVPSRSLEGFGLVVAESLACGTPVIVTDAGGLPEAVRPLDPTLVVTASGSEALADRLRRARDGELPGRDRCHAYAARFGSTRVIEQHLEVYRHARTAPARDRCRIVYLGHTAAMSGAEIALLRVLPTLARDIDVHVILAEHGPLVSELHAAGISVEVLPMREGARSARRNSLLSAIPGASSYALRLARRLRQLDPDLVHTNSLKAALYGGAAGRAAGVPTIWHVHDRIADDYLPGLAVRGVRLAARVLPAAVIANSKTTLETLPGVSHTTVVPNVIPHPFAPRTRERDPQIFRVGMVGRIAHWKGQHVFLEAFARAFPTGTAQAVIVGAPLFGPDEDDYLDDLRALGHELGLQERVLFTGFRENVAAELATLDALVHASLTPEPFGQVILEGMASGLAVVATRAGGPTEFVQDGTDGLLYPPGDVDALADLLTRIAADPELRARLGKAAAVTALSFTAESVASSITAVYRGVLSSRRSRATGPFGNDGERRATAQRRADR